MMVKENGKKESLTKIIAITILALVSLYILLTAFTGNNSSYLGHGMMQREYNDTVFLYSNGVSGGVNSVVIQLVGLLISLGILLVTALLIEKVTGQEKKKLNRNIADANSTRECPLCSSQISDEFKFCPVCNAKLIAECVKCKRIIQQTWHYCPYCGGAKDLAQHKI
jgi:RNA polymerase subunit RPABC4/transcription elongation factor Spt4